jgi:hypothetical protein
MPAEMKEYLENTSWTSFHVGYHSINVADDDSSETMMKKLIRTPIRVLKWIDPSLRQLILITAKK